MSATEIGATLRAAYVRLLEQQFGLRLTTRQAAELDGVVTKLVASTSLADPAQLYAALAAGLFPRLLEGLATSMTVGETHFFRVTPQIEALRRTVLPDLIRRHTADRRLRLWSAGCSTGEEPYTLAMLICELLSEPTDWDIQLVASDLNPAALQAAQLSVYGEWSFRDSPPQVRTRHFTPTDHRRWRLNDAVRGMVRFVHHNLAQDRFPFISEGERIDLIVCRNVTIYFAEHAAQDLYRRFAEALQPAGWLLLGPSDTAPTASQLDLVACDGALLWRRRDVAKPVPVSAPPAARPRVVPRLAGGKRPAPATPTSPSMDPLVHLQVGMVRLGEGASAAAIDSLRRAAFLDETSPLVQFSLGRAYRQIGDPSRSRSAFARARRLLAGLDDDQPLAGGDVATGELRHAVETQLADLDRRAS